ncbi:MAG: efflux RND transporter permease subunit, partial [Thermodesulfobacteriota bacterium]
MSLYSPSDTPLALLAVTGGASLAETAQWVHEKLKPGLSRIKGIAAVHIIGSPPTEIVVDCDDARLKALGITVPGVSNLIARGHKSTSAGFLTANDRRMAVRVAGDFKSCSQIGGQPVAVTDRGGITAVGDVARVSKFSHQPHETSRLNGRNLISVALYRSGDSEPRTLWAAVREELSRIRLEDSASHSIDAIYSQGQELAAAFSRLGWILVIAVAVAAVALLFFLGSITPTLIVALSIPFSLLVTRLFMYVFNVPLDLVSMSGLIIGVGLLVDNSIVVAEAISVQCLREGSRGEKILAGVQEVAAPLVVSTFTTILAFLPLVFVSPQIRRFYAGLTSSVSLSLAVSLIAALVLVPLLLRLIPGALTQRASTFPHGLGKLPSAYGRTLHVIRSRPGLICAAAGVLLLVSVAQIPRLAFGDRGSSYERDIQVALVMPPGTARNVTQDQIHLVEQVLMKIEGLDAVYSRTWANQGLITVKFKERHSFEQTAGDFIESVRERLKETTRAQTHVWPTGAKERDATLSVILSGPSLEKLSAGARMVRSALLEIAGVRDVMALHGDTVPALEFRLRHEKIGFYHVGARDVAEYVRSHVTGPVAARVFEGEREVKVRVRSLRQDHETSDSVRRSFLKLKDGGMVPLPELISPHRTLAPTEMHRENRSRVARLEVLLAKDTDLLGTATRIKAELDRFTLPEGYGVKLGDQMDRIVRTRSEMLLAAIVAVVFVYLLLVSATESFLKPI